MARSAILNVMVRAAEKAARRINRDFGEVENLQVSRKGPGDFVTIADRRAEETIRDELEWARPGWSFLMEESGEIEGRDTTRRWIIDPIDGTTNFLHGIPHFAISIAAEEQGRITAGIILNPVTGDLFTAERGSGAFYNDRRMRVAQRKKLVDCVAATGVPHLGRGDHGAYLHDISRVMREVAGVRRFGSAALDLAYLAAGRFDVFFEDGLAPWDVAAGILMVREAGGFVSDRDGRQEMFSTGSIVAGNEDVHGQLLAILKEARKRHHLTAPGTAGDEGSQS
ncbi:MAG: inositol monophosphatase [Hyphomicrobiaceae bacterium]|nr:inositol monophosphatase [Hyphomicrobiaceae bacterium]